MDEQPVRAPEQKDWQRVVKPEKRGRSRWVYVGIVIVLFVIAFVVGTQDAVTGLFVGGGVVEGDSVSVLYAGSLEDGTVFDTNIPERAQAAGLERTTFDPLEFTVGAGSVIEGFDEAVLGMRVGQTKTVTIPPEQGYGLPDPSLIQTVERVQVLERVETIPRELDIPAAAFATVYGLHAEGDVFSPEDSEIEYEVIEVGDEFVTVKFLAVEGQEVTLEGAVWSGTILEVTEDEATIKYNPEEEDVDTGYGTASVEVTEDEIIITHNPIIGSEVPTLLGTARISGVDEESIMVDLNHFLAGKTLTFEITLLEFQ